MPTRPRYRLIAAAAASDFHAACAEPSLLFSAALL